MGSGALRSPTGPGWAALGAATQPVLADGHYQAYISRVAVPHEGGTSRLVVDLVQVFDGQAARDAAIADGVARDKAQYLGV
jgi:hypothetical protein